MKRNYLMAGALTLLTSAALSLAITAAPAEGWHKVGAERKAPKIEKFQSSKTRYQRSLGKVGSSSQLIPLHDGVQRTPTSNGRNAAKQRNVTHRTVEQPRGNVYAIVNRFTEMEIAQEAFMGPLNLSTGVLTKMYEGAEYCPYVSEDYLLQCNSYRKGQIFCPGYEGGVGGFEYVWNVVDLATGERAGRISFGGDDMADPYSLTYDEKHDLFYGLSLSNETGTEANLNVFFPDRFVYNVTGANEEDMPGKPGAYKYLGYLGSDNRHIAGIAYDSKNDQLYGFDSDNNVWIIEVKFEDGVPEEASVMEAGYLGTDLGLYPLDAYGGISSAPITYSPMDEMFVSIYRDNEIRANRLVFIDPTDWEVYEGKVVTCHTVPYIPSLICTDDFAEAEAPELAAEPVLNFENEKTDGTITFTVPELTYYGVAIGSTPVKATLKIDDKVVFEGEMKAGESKTISQSVPEGLHTLTLTTAIGEYVSPVRTVVFYTGYDNPVTPGDLYLDIDKLTWTAPGAVGENGGYVDTAVIEYNVYVNGVMQNAVPVEEEEFVLDMPDEMKRTKIEVEAVSRGKVSRRAVLDDVIGKPLPLPQSFAPSEAQSTLFHVVDVNNDGQRWRFNHTLAEVVGESTPIWGFVVGYYEDANDWLIFPAIQFDDPSKLYNIAFDIASAYTGGSEEAFEIFVGKRPTVKALKEGTCIYKRDNYMATIEWQNISANFGVEAAGQYYIGIHCYSSKAVDAWGLSLKDIRISAVDGKTSAVPGNPTEVRMIPAEFGGQGAYCEAVLPTKDIVGNDLDPNDDITLTIVNNLNDSYTGTVTGKPGQKVTSEEVGHDNDGFVDYEITPSNANGAGYTVIRRTYVGIDKPLAPTNIKGVPSSDNLSMNLTWDAPGEVGYNGGYVDVSELTYNLYTRSGVSYYLVGNVDQTHCNYNPNNPKLDTYYVGPAAVNGAGESVNSRFVQDQLGTPYTAPVKENFNTSQFTYNPYTYMTQNNETGRYDGSSWENVGNAEMNEALIGAKPNQGALISFSTIGGPCDTKLILPKVSTIGLGRANFVLRYFDNIDTPEITIYGRRDGHAEEEALHTFVPTNSAQGQWMEDHFTLPEEYLNCNWVQMRIFAHLKGSDTEYLVIDSWSIFPDAEYDLGITQMNGPSQASLGDNITYDLTVTNAGSEVHSGVLTIDLVDEAGKVYATDETRISDLASTEVFERNATFSLDGSMSDVSNLKVRATVTATPDEIETNNVKEIALDIHASQVPVVKDLDGKVIENGSVDLTWSTPATQFGGFENAEFLPAFQISNTIGMWQNVDQDGLKPATLQNGAINLTWEGSTEPQGWTVVDAEALNLQNEPRTAPHSGKQYLMARCADIPTEGNPDDYQSSKWLISPEIEGGTTVSFWMNTLSADTEYIEIWFSETGTKLGEISKLQKDKCGDFTTRIPKSKSGEDTWELITVKAPKKAKYFAIRFCSFDGLAVMIDDISFTQKDLMSRDVTSYSLFRSDDNADFKLVADKITGNSFNDATYADSKAHYHLVAYADVDGKQVAGPKSNDLYIAGSSVADINAAAMVVGRTGEVLLIGFEGQKAEIFSTDGKVVVNTTVRANQASYALDGGIYLVKVGDKSYKVVVK